MSVLQRSGQQLPCSSSHQSSLGSPVLHHAALDSLDRSKHGQKGGLREDTESGWVRNIQHDLDGRYGWSLDVGALCDDRPHSDGRLRRQAPADHMSVLSSGDSAAHHPPSIAAASRSGSCPMAPRGGGGGAPLPGTEDDEPVDLGWLVEAQDVPENDPATSAATSDPPIPSDRVSPSQPMLHHVDLQTE